ncbi:MAG: 50S ribosomal protein L10 [Deltaproteobacteria bacterium]|nr:50S ribosomal protein L10 [Deltaproteobacteria bacterium]
MSRETKEKVLADLAGRVSRSKAALVADHQGLKVKDVSEIRRKLREAGVDYRVAKNTLLKRALAGTGREALSKSLRNTSAILMVYTDEYGKLGKTAQELAKKFDKLKVKAGFVEKDVINGPNALEVMAALPTLDEARAQLLGVINAPAQKLLAQLNAPGSNLAGVLQAKIDKDNEDRSAVRENGIG